MQKPTIDTLIFPRWVVPIEPHDLFYQDYALALNDGRILDLLPKSQAEEKYNAAETLHLAEHVILPGFVNAHTHSPMALFRGLADDLPLMTWLTEHIWPAENRWLSEEFIHDASNFALVEMLHCGTTCFQEHYLFPETIAQVAKTAKMRACIGMFMIGAKTSWGDDLNEYIEKGLDLHRRYENAALIKINLAPHAPYTLDDAALSRIRELAEDLKLSIHMHVHESANEIEQSLKQYDKRPLQRLYDLGLFNLPFQAVHMVHLDSDDLRLLQNNAKISVIHCPDSNLKLGNGFCPIHKLLQLGINVALATDSAASNNDLDIIAEMRMAAILAKGINRDPTALPAAQALQIATLNGARALGLEKEIGSILPGKAADIIAIDLSHFHTQPVYNPISHLVYAANARQVSDVWVAGKRLMAKGKLTTLDENAILVKTKTWGRKIASP